MTPPNVPRRMRLAPDLTVPAEVIGAPAGLNRRKDPSGTLTELSAARMKLFPPPKNANVPEWVSAERMRTFAWCNALNPPESRPTRKTLPGAAGVRRPNAN